MGLGDYPNFVAPNERHLHQAPVPEGTAMSEESQEPQHAEELALTEFELECRVDVKWDAKDVATQLTPLDVLQLTEELDEEVGLWEYTVLMARYFSAQLEVAQKERPDLVAMTTDELEHRLKQHEEKNK